MIRINRHKFGVFRSLLPAGLLAIALVTSAASAHRPAARAGQPSGNTPEWLICALLAIPGIR